MIRRGRGSADIAAINQVHPVLLPVVTQRCLPDGCDRKGGGDSHCYRLVGGLYGDHWRCQHRQRSIGTGHRSARVRDDDRIISPIVRRHGADGQDRIGGTADCSHPFVRFTPLVCHWYFNGAVPVATTARVAVVPTPTVWFVGCTVIVGGIFVTRNRIGTGHRPDQIRDDDRVAAAVGRLRVADRRVSLVAPLICPLLRPDLSH